MRPEGNASMDERIFFNYMTNLSQITHVRPHFINDRGRRQLWFKRATHRHCKLLYMRRGSCRVKSEELSFWRFHVGLRTDRPQMFRLTGWLDERRRRPIAWRITGLAVSDVTAHSVSHTRTTCSAYTVQPLRFIDANLHFTWRKT